MRRRHCLIYLVLKKNEKDKFFFADSVSDIFSMVLYKEEIGKSLFEKKPQMKMNIKKKNKKTWISNLHLIRESFNGTDVNWTLSFLQRGSFTLTVLFIHLLSQFFTFIYSHSSFHSITLTVLFIHLLSQFFSFTYSHSSFHSFTLTVLFIHLLSQFFSFNYSHSSFHSLTLTVLFIHLLSQFFSFSRIKQFYLFGRQGFKCNPSLVKSLPSHIFLATSRDYLSILTLSGTVQSLEVA